MPDGDNQPVPLTVPQHVVVNVGGKSEVPSKPVEKSRLGFFRDNWQILVAILAIAFTLPGGWMSVELAKKDILSSQALLDASKQTHEATLKAATDSLQKTADKSTDLAEKLGKTTGSLDASEQRLEKLMAQIDTASKKADEIFVSVIEQETKIKDIDKEIRNSKNAISQTVAEQLARDQDFRKQTILAMSGDIRALEQRLSKIEKCVTQLPTVTIPTTGASHPLVNIKDRSALYIIRFCGPSSIDLIDVVNFSAFQTAGMEFTSTILGSTPSNKGNTGAIVSAKYNYDKINLRVMVTLNTDTGAVYQNVTAFILEIKPH
jgi:hypothetical protein